MLPSNLYLFMHLLGAFLLVLGYGALLARAVLNPAHRPMRIVGSAISGIGLFLIVLGGFGMKAKMHYEWPTWLIIKIAVWLLLGIALAAINRNPAWNKVMWGVVIVLAGFAAWLGVIGKNIPALQ